MLTSYRRLDSLLEAQKDALIQGDHQKRDALQAQIEHLRQEIEQFSDQFPSEPSGTREELKRLLPGIAGRIEENQKLWATQLEKVQLQSDQLKSTRRYVAARQEAASRGSRYRRTG